MELVFLSRNKSEGEKEGLWLGLTFGGLKTNEMKRRKRSKQKMVQP